MNERLMETCVVTLAELLRCSPENVRPTDRLAEDLGVDSLMLMKLIVGIERRLGSRLPAGSEGYFVGLSTVADLARALTHSLEMP